MAPPLELAVGVLAMVAPPLERLHWVPTLEASLVIVFSVEKEEVGVLDWLLVVGKSAAGAVEAGSLEELTVKRGYLVQLQPQKISGSGLLALPAGILRSIGASFPSVRSLRLWLQRLRCLWG